VRKPNDPGTTQANANYDQPAFLSPAIEDDEFDLRGVLGVLRRRLRLILVTILLVLAVTGGIMLTLKPVYTASTLILVDPSRKDLLDPEAQMQGTSSDSARVESEVELVKSETTLLRVIEELNLVADPEFGVSLGLRDRLLAFLRIAEPQLPTGEAALQDVLGKVRDAVSAQRRGLTYLIAVQARAFDPARAATLANAVADAYIREQLEAKVRSTLASRDIINDRIAEAQQAVATSEQAFDGFIESNIDAITRETGRTDLAALRQQLQNVNADRARVASLAELANGSLTRRDWAGVASQLQSDALEQLEQQRRELETSFAGVADGSQRAIDLSAELDALEARMLDTAAAELTTLRQRIASSQAQATDLRVQLRSSVLSSDLPAAVLTSIYGLQQNAEIARTQYQTLLARLNDLNTQSTLQIPDSRIVSEALAPGDPSFPNPRLILSVAGVVALGLAISLAFLVENFVGGFTSEGQLKAVLKTPAVVAVPRQKGQASIGSDGLGVADAITSAPLSSFAEAVRRIQIGVENRLRRAGRLRGDGAVIMVTSAVPNEGKTTMALSLARAYALSGHSTLLIDCDLRRPSVHRHLGMDTSAGLLEYLGTSESDVTLASILTIDQPSGAQVIVGARRSGIATDQLVTGAAFADLVQSARKSFEVVILDTPPIGPVVDGLHLVQHADCVVFVVRWADTSQSEAKGAINALREVMRPDTGILAVLNQQNRDQLSYRYSYYNYYTES
jgi:succinoglycan biosynthesis transport protein ExoP